MTALGKLGKPCIISPLIVGGENSEAGARTKARQEEYFFLLPHLQAFLSC